MVNSRTRDRSSIVEVPTKVLETHNVTGVIQSRGGSAALLQRQIMRDISTPGFRRKKSSGEIIISPMCRLVETDVVSPVGEAKLATQTNTYVESLSSLTTSVTYLGHTLRVPWTLADHGSTIAGMKEVDDVVARLEAASITEAYSRVGEPDLDSLTELAELKETLAFLWSPVKSMVNLTKRFRSHLDHIEKANTRYARRYSRWEKRNPARRGDPPPVPKYRDFTVGKFSGTDVSSSWLAYRYGLMPLIYTFQDVQKLLANFDKFETRSTARSTAEKVISLEAALTPRTIEYGGGVFTDQFTRIGAARVKSRAGVLYVPDMSLTRRVGLQLHRVPMTMYELIPLSFVADWFQNGTSVYNALTAEFRAMKIHGAWVVTSIEYDYSIGYTCVAVRDAVAEVTGTPRTIYGKWQRRRTVGLSDVEFQLKLDLNTKRIADGLALIHTFLATAKSKR